MPEQRASLTSIEDLPNALKELGCPYGAALAQYLDFQSKAKRLPPVISLRDEDDIQRGTLGVPQKGITPFDDLAVWIESRTVQLSQEPEAAKEQIELLDWLSHIYIEREKVDEKGVGHA